MKKILLLLCILSITPFHLLAQNVKNVKAKSLSLDNVEIAYDLEKVNTQEELYKIEIYSSHNGYSFPLDKLSGDIGTSVKPGKDKKVVWTASQELNGFEGNISFKVKATLISAPWQLITPKTNGKLQKGKKNTIVWSGMSKGAETVSIEIKSKENGEVRTEQFSNTGNQKIAIPKNLKSGYYELVVSNANGQGSTTSLVKVKNKIPLIVKLSPLALIGAAAGVYIVTQGSDTKNPESGSGTSLPAPPSTP